MAPRIAPRSPSPRTSIEHDYCATGNPWSKEATLPAAGCRLPARKECRGIAYNPRNCSTGIAKYANARAKRWRVSLLLARVKSQVARVVPHMARLPTSSHYTLLYLYLSLLEEEKEREQEGKGKNAGAGCGAGYMEGGAGYDPWRGLTRANPRHPVCRKINHMTSETRGWRGCAGCAAPTLLTKALGALHGAS